MFALYKNSNHKLIAETQNNINGIKLKKNTPYIPKYEIIIKLTKFVKIKNIKKNKKACSVKNQDLISSIKLNIKKKLPKILSVLITIKFRIKLKKKKTKS